MARLNCSDPGGDIYAKLANGVARHNCARASPAKIQWRHSVNPNVKWFDAPLVLQVCASLASQGRYGSQSWPNHLTRRDRSWLIRVYLGRDHETKKRSTHNRTIHGPMREAQPVGGRGELTDTGGKVNGYYIQYLTFTNPKRISCQERNFLLAAECRAITLSESFEASIGIRGQMNL